MRGRTLCTFLDRNAPDGLESAGTAVFDQNVNIDENLVGERDNLSEITFDTFNGWHWRDEIQPEHHSGASSEITYDTPDWFENSGDDRNSVSNNNNEY